MTWTPIEQSVDFKLENQSGLGWYWLELPEYGNAWQGPFHTWEEAAADAKYMISLKRNPP